jgi:hypothetical protein
MLQKATSSQLSRLAPLGYITLTNHKGTFVYVSDIDALKIKFEALNPTKTLSFTAGPCLYFYDIRINQKRLNTNPMEKSATKYFFHLNHFTNPVNLLEDDIREKFKSFNNTLLQDIEGFTNNLKISLEDSNNFHKRCKMKLRLEIVTDPYSKEQCVHIVRENLTILLSGRFIEVKREF